MLVSRNLSSKKVHTVIRTMSGLLVHGGVEQSLQHPAVPTIVTSITGDVVRYPPGKLRPVSFPVYAVGAKAVELSLFPDESQFRAKQVNEANMHYLENRGLMMQKFTGKWVAFSSKGRCLVTETEDEVYTWANRMFGPIGTEDYYAQCLGCEVCSVVHMDGSGVGSAGGSPGKLTGAVRPPGLQRDLPVTERSVQVRGEFSAGAGRPFESFEMKWDPGADLVGVPPSVLSQYSLSEQRVGQETVHFGGVPRVVQRYRGIYLKIAGLVTKCDVVQMPAEKWLLGYDVICRYRAVLDYSQDQWLTMAPLEGEKDDA